ncbi:MAG: hypothetical protein OEZ52_14895, partial [Candidatus Aminicenantes bacterium]|nr:hypothetical protein [Candidatus Aminicenantes bacterium]
FGGVFTHFFFVFGEIWSDKFSVHECTPGVRLRIRFGTFSLYSILTSLGENSKRIPHQLA